MIDPFWPALLVKMLATAGLVVATATAVERAGPLIGALIATLPLSAGPAYVILALDHDAAFISRSALTSMIGATSHSIFVVVYVLAAQGWSTPASVGAALASWIAAVLVLRQFDWSWQALLSACLAGYGLALLVIRPYLGARALEHPKARWFDPLLRGVLVMTLVATVMVTGRILGPEAAGIAAVMPLIFTSLVMLLQPRIGGPAAAAVIGNGTVAMVGSGLALTSLHVWATTLGTPAALLVALAICVGWNLMLLGYGLSRRRRLRARRS